MHADNSAPGPQKPVYLPFTPGTPVTEYQWPLRLRPRSVRIKYGYAWRILLRSETLVMAEAVSLRIPGTKFYLVFVPEVEEASGSGDDRVPKHEVIPEPATWKDDIHKFQYRTNAIEQLLTPKPGKKSSITS